MSHDDVLWIVVLAVLFVLAAAGLIGLGRLAEGSRLRDFLAPVATGMLALSGIMLLIVGLASTVYLPR